MSPGRTCSYSNYYFTNSRIYALLALIIRGNRNIQCKVLRHTGLQLSDSCTSLD